MARDEQTISKNMSRIRGKDTSIEITLRKALWKQGIRYRKNYKKLPGSPDIAITKYKLAIFCDSEFFHGKDWDILKPRLAAGKNPDYWVKKIERNRERDVEIDKKSSISGLNLDSDSTIVSIHKPLLPQLQVYVKVPVSTSTSIDIISPFYRYLLCVDL